MVAYVKTHERYDELSKEDAMRELVGVMIDDIGAAQGFLQAIGVDADLYALTRSTTAETGSRIFSDPDFGRAILPSTCPHPWDAVHYWNQDLTEEVVACGRCGATLAVHTHEEPVELVPAADAPVRGDDGEAPESVVAAPPIDPG